MKKLFVLAAILAVVFAFAACPADDGDSGSDSYFIGTWTFTDYFSEINLDINDDKTWAIMGTYQGSTLNDIGAWTRSGNSLSLKYDGSKAEKEEGGGKGLVLHWQNPGMAILLIKKSDIPGGATSLTIRNQSSYTFTDVLWNNTSFVYNQTEKSIPFGTNVTMAVQSGSGYIYFKFNSKSYRTREAVTVDKNEKTEFTFLNSTVVVDVDDTSNTGPLSGF